MPSIQIYPLTLIYTALTYLYEASNNLGLPTNQAGKAILDQKQNALGSVAGIFGLGKLVDGPVAYTKQGYLRGTNHRSRNGDEYYFFKGIPYASPPMGKLRFEPPEPHQGWNGVREARVFRSECLQNSILTLALDGSEDCLYLNVATQTIFSGVTELRPVVVWIHGGFFFFGGGHTYLPTYWIEVDVVVVTINYRLGSLGFLNTGDGTVAGNMGLKDQVAALRWVRENIIYFNGDPNRVTIIGQSAGGASVHYMTLSRLASGLFSGAISMSGTALSHWVFVNDPGKQAKEFADSVGCPSWDTYEMVSCLKSVPAQRLVLNHARYFGDQSHSNRFYFAPTIDSGPVTNNTFLIKHPFELLKSGEVARIPWITGVTNGEGCINLVSILRNDSQRTEFNQRWSEVAPYFLGYENHPNSSFISKAIRKYYLGGGDITKETMVRASNMFSDRGWYLDNHESAFLHSHYAPTYVYYNTYQGRLSLARLLLKDTKLPLPARLDYIAGTVIEWIKIQLLNQKRSSPLGVCHADDLVILFDIAGLRPQIKSKLDVDYFFSRRLVNLFYSFVKTGTPILSYQEAREGVEWRPVKIAKNHVPYKRLRFDDKFSLIEEPFHERLLFWNDLFNFVGSRKDLYL